MAGAENPNGCLFLYSHFLIAFSERIVYNPYQSPNAENLEYNPFDRSCNFLFTLYPGVAQLVGRLVWDCEIGNSSKILDTSKKPLILRFFRFHILGKYAKICLRPHSVPQLRNFCKNPSIKLNISGCGAVGSARHLGAGTPNRFDFPKCCILPFIFAITPDYFR